jgi:hypothetical protein
LEAMGGPAGKLPYTPIQRPYFSTSLQIAPGIRNYRPEVGHLPVEGHWYTGMEYSEDANNTGLNPFFYGVTRSQVEDLHLSVGCVVGKHADRLKSLHRISYLPCGMGAIGRQWERRVHQMVFG